jgi:DNA-binding PadR family transcriptional regulator
LLILVGLSNGCPQSAYDIILFIHKKFDVLLSTGTVYANLYRLERNNLVSAKSTERKRVYTLTENGKKAIERIMDDYEKIQSFVNNPKTRIGSLPLLKRVEKTVTEDNKRR